MAPSLTLYYAKGTRSSRVQFLLEELNLQYSLESEVTSRIKGPKTVLNPLTDPSGTKRSQRGPAHAVAGMRTRISLKGGLYTFSAVILLHMQGLVCRVFSTAFKLSLVIYKALQTLETIKEQPYLSLHPLGKLPVLQDGDITILESGAVIQYILFQYGDKRLQASVSTHSNVATSSCP